jgi:HEAT repeat protein
VSEGSGSLGLFTIDCAFVVRSWNRWLAEATGIHEEHARGRPLVELYPELKTRGLLARFQRVCDDGVVDVLAPAFHAYLLPCPPRVASARFAHMQQLVTLEPIREGDALLGVLVTIEDVTARRERERELAEQLSSPDDGVRLQAVRALAADSGAIAPLAGALGDPSWRVRRAAADGLASEADETSVDVLIATLRERHRDPAVLNATLTALVNTRQDILPSLLDTFRSATDADLRMYVALALGLLGDPRAVPLLAGALADPDPNVRYHAVEALGRIRSREAAAEVAEVARSGDFSLAFVALDTLALIGEPSVAPDVVPLLADELLEAAAAEALGTFGREDVIAPLAARLASPGADVTALAGALAGLSARLDGHGDTDGLVADVARAMTPADALQHMIGALATAREGERIALLEVLGWLETEPVAAIGAMLAHDDTRRAAAAILSSRGHSAVALLVDALAQDDRQVRMAAAVALGRIGAARAVPALIELLHAEEDVAAVAAGALGSIGDQDALPALFEALDHPHAAVRRAAAAALHSIGGPETEQKLGALLTHPSPRVREGAVEIAGYFAVADCLDALLARCEDASEAVQRAAIEQLPQFDDARARAALARALKTGTSGVRAAAARALALVPAAEAIPHLLDAARDADPWVRYYTARSAGHHRHGALVGMLKALATSDAIPPVRIAAIEALAQLGDTPALAALVPVCDDADLAVAQAALLALGPSRDPSTLPALLAGLESAEGGRQLAALQALERRGEPGVVPAVAALARDNTVNVDVRSRALSTLGAIGGAAAVAALIELAEVPARTAAVVDVLSALDESQLEWIEPGLAHPSAGIRLTLIDALGRMRHASAATLLAATLRDENPAVRRAGARALERVDIRSTRATSVGTK